MRALISKQRLRTFFCFFLNIFFSLHIWEKPFLSNKEIVWRNMSFFFFFCDFVSERYCRMEQFHVSIKQLLSKPKRPIPQKDSKHETKQLKVKKNSERGYLQFLVFSKIRKHKNTASTALVEKNNFDVVFFVFTTFKKKLWNFWKSIRHFNFHPLFFSFFYYCLLQWFWMSVFFVGSG